MPELYEYQKQTVRALCRGKRYAILGTGTGKMAITLKWAREQSLNGVKNIVIVTTASKAHSGDVEAEADLWNGPEWRASLSSFVVLSWHKLSAWTKENLARVRANPNAYAFAFDECRRMAGYSTGMGKAVQNIVRHCDKWTGYTATPGDAWKDFMAYFVASGCMKNKTEFLNKYCIMQTYKGYPEIVRYLHEDVMDRMWKTLAYIPDTSEMSRELPEESHFRKLFKAPSDYKKIMQSSTNRDGEFIDSTMGLCHYLRQICFTKEKQEWLGDFMEGLGTNCVFFCNYIEEEETLCELAKKRLPKSAKVWRIDGKHHDIPTADTIGKYDIVVAHYQSGGEALNLQFVNYWCAVSPNYSYSTHVQAQGRIRRIGQKRPMYFYELGTRGTIEQAIYATLERKQDFALKEWCAENGIDKA